MNPALMILIPAAVAVAAGLALITKALAERTGEVPKAAVRPDSAWARFAADPKAWRRAGIAAMAGLVAGLFTGWPIAAVMVGAGVWFLPSLLGRDVTGKAQIARTESIATWAEMMRDTLSAAAGLEQSILATASAAPEPIRAEVSALAADIRGGTKMGDALTAFGQALADPIGDMIVAALLMATRNSARNLAGAMGALADAARAQASLQMRTAADRARTRTSVRVIIGTVLGMAVGLVMLNRPYLSPYDSPVGQIVLGMVAALFAFALTWLAKIAKGKPVRRFLATIEQDPDVLRGAR
jgi:tight adherence protein B